MIENPPAIPSWNPYNKQNNNNVFSNNYLYVIISLWITHFSIFVNLELWLGGKFVGRADGSCQPQNDLTATRWVVILMCLHRSLWTCGCVLGKGFLSSFCFIANKNLSEVCSLFFPLGHCWLYKIYPPLISRLFSMEISKLNHFSISGYELLCSVRTFLSVADGRNGSEWYVSRLKNDLLSWADFFTSLVPLLYHDPWIYHLLNASLSSTTIKLWLP